MKTQWSYGNDFQQTELSLVVSSTVTLNQNELNVGNHCNGLCLRPERLFIKCGNKFGFYGISKWR
jgi:hypothetical protein